MKQFAMFTKDVMGQMRPNRGYAKGRYEVIPAGGGTAKSGGAGTTRALLECIAQLAQAAKSPARTCKDSSLSRLDRAIDTLEHSAGQARAAKLAARSACRPIPDAPGAGPNAWELMNQAQPSFADMSRVSAEDMARRCAESQAAYAARNPHSKEDAQT